MANAQNPNVEADFTPLLETPRVRRSNARYFHVFEAAQNAVPTPENHALIDNFHEEFHRLLGGIDDAVEQEVILDLLDKVTKSLLSTYSRAPPGIHDPPAPGMSLADALAQLPAGDGNQRRPRRQRRDDDSSEEDITEPADSLKPLHFALSQTAGVVTLRTFRDQFFNHLCAFTMQVAQPNGPVELSYTPEVAANITNYLYAEVMGLPGRLRLTAFVRHYNGISEEGFAVHQASVKAATISENDNVPAPIRNFCRTFVRHLNVQGTKSTVYHQVFQQLERIELLGRYDRLVQHLTPGARYHDAIMNFLAAQGYHMGRRGVDGRSLLISYFVAALGFTGRTQFVNHIQSGKQLRAIVTFFGHGVLLFLPPGSMTRLKVWSEHQMDYAYRLLAHWLPDFAVACRMANDNIIIPAARGEPLSLQFEGGSGSEDRYSLLDLLRERV